MSTRSERKARVVALLAGRDLPGIRSWIEDERGAFEMLFPLLLHRDEMLGWRALEALGLVSASRPIETVRDRIRRLLWSMSHESGNAVPLAADAAGEMASSARLVGEFARPIASFIGIEPFVRGVHRAVARMAGVDPAPLAYLSPYLARALGHSDPVIRAHSALALLCVDPPSRSRVLALEADDARLSSYDRRTGAIVTTTVGEALRGSRCR